MERNLDLIAGTLEQYARDPAEPERRRADLLRQLAADPANIDRLKKIGIPLDKLPKM